MSRGLSTDNPIVLFGNIGPDVCLVSQIYDPDNDQYIKTEDITLQAKTYYNRSYANKTITFTPVENPASTANPKDEGWYEVNEAHADQTGKYVPAPKSLVVCDVAYENFKARSVLIVDSVDDQGDNPTFKSILVPALNGQDTEVSARIVDYGNDRFMLYMENDDGVMRLCPDRKLMLYGHRLYAYALRNAKGRSIAVPDRSLIGITNDALIPYSGETTEAVSIGTSNVGSYKGKLFTTLIGSNYRTTVIPDTADSSVRCKALDEYYLQGKTYYLESYDNTGKRTFRTLVPGTDYISKTANPSQTNMTKLGELLTGDDPGFARIYVAGNEFLKGVSGYLTYTGWITDTTKEEATIRYPERCYLKTGESLTSGETVTMEVYEFEGDSYRMVLSLTLIAKPGTVLEASTKITKQLDHMGVLVENADKDVDGAVKLEVGSTTANWIFHPILYFNDGTSAVVELDGKQSFMYGLGNVNSSNVGQEFSLLFKYFPSDKTTVNENMSKNFVSTTLTVRVVAGSSSTITKVSTVPVWSYNDAKYVFRFLPYNSKGTEPKMIEEDGSFDGATHLLFNNASFKDPNGNIRALSPNLLGENFGLYEHGRLALVVKANGYETDVYRQNVAMRLQPWTTSSIATKWLLGSFKTDTDVIEEYTSGEVPYGSTSDAVRPWIECVKEDSGYSFRIGRKTATSYMTRAEFLENYFRKAYPDPVDHDEDVTHNSINRYRLRTIAEIDTYDALSSEYALEGVEYYRDGELVPTVPGKTRVTRYGIRVQAEFKYFGQNETTGEFEEVTGLNVGDDLTTTQRNTLFIQRKRPIVSEWKTFPIDSFDDLTSKIELKVDNVRIEGERYYPTNTLGGPLPTVVGEDGNLWNTQVMGSVIVEFATKDEESVDYKFVYGVPVEVRFPYSPTADTTYQSGKAYFTYNPTNNIFVAESFTPGADIPAAPQRFERVV